MHDRYATAHLAEFLAEVRASRRPVCRRFYGPDLARELKHIWREWRAKGMERGLAEVLTCGMYRAMAAREVTKWSSGRVTRWSSVGAASSPRFDTAPALPRFIDPFPPPPV